MRETPLSLTGGEINYILYLYFLLNDGATVPTYAILCRSDSKGSDGRKKKRVDYKRAIEGFDPSLPELKIPLPFTLKKQVSHIDS